MHIYVTAWTMSCISMEWGTGGPWDLVIAKVCWKAVILCSHVTLRNRKLVVISSSAESASSDEEMTPYFAFLGRPVPVSAHPKVIRGRVR